MLAIVGWVDLVAVLDWFSRYVLKGAETVTTKGEVMGIIH